MSTIATLVKGQVVPVKRIVGDNPRDDQIVHLASDQAAASDYIRKHQGKTVDGKWIGPALYTTIRDVRRRHMKGS